MVLKHVKLTNLKQTYRLINSDMLNFIANFVKKKQFVHAYKNLTNSNSNLEINFGQKFKKISN